MISPAEVATRNEGADKGKETSAAPAARKTAVRPHIGGGRKPTPEVSDSVREVRAAGQEIRGPAQREGGHLLARAVGAADRLERHRGRARQVHRGLQRTFPSTVAAERPVAPGGARERESARVPRPPRAGRRR